MRSRSELPSPWPAVTLSYLSLAALYVNIFSIPPVTLILVRELGINHFQAGLLMTVYSVSYCVNNLFTGVLSDRWGPKRVMGLGLILGFLSSMMFTFTDHFGAMLVSRALIGFSAASMTSPCMIYILSLLSPQERGLGVSGHLASLTLGSGIVFLITPLLVQAYPWRAVLQAYALLGLIPFILFCIWGRDRLPGTSFSPLHKAESKAGLWSVPMMLLAGILFITLFQIGGTLTWIAPWLEERCRLSPFEVGVGAMTFALAGIPSAILGGYLSSRYRPGQTQKIVRLSTAGMLISTSTVAFVWLETWRSLPLVLVVIFLARWGSFMSTGPLLSMVPKLVRPELSGLAVGFVNSAALAGGFLSSLLGGYIIERTGQYRWLWILFSASLLFSALVLHPALNRKMSRIPMRPSRSQSDQEPHERPND